MKHSLMEMVRKTDGKTKIKGKNMKNILKVGSETNNTETRRTYLTNRKQRKKDSLKKVL
jgi:hypothetical protein